MEDHHEEHITLSPAVRDIIIGLSDGLTVPFAIAAGLASAAVGNSTIIIAAVLAEIAAGSISMGLGGYLAADTEAEHYANERRREEREVEEKPEVEKREVAEVFKQFGLSAVDIQPLVEALANRKEDWINFMMRFELGLEEPAHARAAISAFTIAGAYIIGGLIPLGPYLVLRNDVHMAFLYSIFLTLIALLIFGYVRGRLVTEHPWRGMIQTVVVGALAATAAFFLAQLVS
jgi:vacuolar iron transporter family protein